MGTDKTSEIVNAIRNYENMQITVDSTPAEITALYEQLTNPSSLRNDGMPHSHNPSSGEEALAVGIDRLDVVRERYEKALCFLLWFKPAWEALTDTERKILETYKHSDGHFGVVASAAAALSYSKSQFHRVRHKALDKLRVLLFGM
jgi:hypothetical protein